MIVLTMLLLMQGISSPVIEDDIVVTGRRVERLKRLRMTAKPDRRTGITRCVYKRRSGDPALDAAVCDAVLACAPKVSTVKDMQACIAPTMNRLVGRGVPWQANPIKDDR